MSNTNILNGSSEPVRSVAASNAPFVFNINKSAKFVFNHLFQFSDRFTGQKDFFSTELRPSGVDDKAINFVSDVYAVQSTTYPDRGLGFSRLGIHLSGNAMLGHIIAIELGTYKKAYRHTVGRQGLFADMAQR
jgi:hypothetical protein